MRKKEQRLWDTMKRSAPKNVWLQRVENMVTEGMPDVLINGHIWVELKAPAVPKKATTRLLGDEGLRQSQINWHMKAQSMKNRTYILVRDETSCLYLIDGYWADEINNWTAQQMAESSLASKWDAVWDELLS